MTTTPIAWPEAQRICDIPEVREALDAFAMDAREENMLAMVSAIMGAGSRPREWTDPVSLGSVNRDYDQGFADGCSESKRLNEHLVEASAQGRAAGLEEEREAFEESVRNQFKWASFGRFPESGDYNLQWIQQRWNGWQARSALSPTSSDAGKDDARDAEMAELIAIGKNLLTQDNRCTDQPLFIVEQKRLIVGIDTEYANKIGWFDSDGMATPEEHEFLEKQYKKSRREPDGWTRTGYSEEWQFVTACFTEQGCKDYIRIDGHNLKEPRIYADGSYRNNEYRTVRNFLMRLAAKNDAALSSLEVIGKGEKG
ncbi:hypothetical protein [Herbaspirillum huttiense]|uniref:hypothetical protein n=1 Tax=Herbaspirillum huttiense TaxID=863372 RepID=UPI0031E21735